MRRDTARLLRWVFLCTSIGVCVGAVHGQSLMEEAIRRGQVAARDSARAHYLKAAQFASEGRYASAIAELRRAMEFQPHDPQLRVDLADLLMASGDRTGAVRELRSLAAQDPPYPPAVIRLGDLRLAEGDTAGAVAQYRRLLQGERPYPPAYVRLGDVAQEAGHRTRAVQYYRKACQADSSYVEAFLSLGSVLVIMDRYDEAMRAFDHAMRIAPDDPAVAQLRSLALQRKQDYEEGMAAGKMRARIIVTATRQEAEQLRRQLLAGADFISLAMKFSIDPTAQVGGDLGFFGPGELIPQFEQAVQGLRPGQISPVIQIPSGYAIILRVN